MISKSMRNLPVAVLLVLAVGCDKQPSTGPTSGGPSTGSSSSGMWVSGRVLNFVTNAGVSGATVAFGDVTTVTDAVGGYTLALPAIGRYDPLVHSSQVALRSALVAEETHVLAAANAVAVFCFLRSWVNGPCTICNKSARPRLLCSAAQAPFSRVIRTL